MSGRHAGEPESCCGRQARAERLSGQPASLKSRGDRSEQSWVQVPKRWMVGLRSTARLKLSDELGLGHQKRSTRAKWRCFRRPRRSVATKRLTGHSVVRDSMTELRRAQQKSRFSLVRNSCIHIGFGNL
jgi:hypothetical protein